MCEIEWHCTYFHDLVVGAALSLAMYYGALPRMLRWLGKIPYCSPNWLSLWRIPLVWAGQYIYLTANGDHNRLFIGLMLTVASLTLDRLDGKMAKSLVAGLKRLRYFEIFSGKTQITLHWPETSDGGLTKQSQLWAWFEEDYLDAEGQPQKRQVKVILEDWVWQLTSPKTRIPMFRVVRDKNNPFDRRLELTGIGEWLDPLVDKLNFLPIFVYLGYRGLVNPVILVLVVIFELASTFMREPFSGLPGFRRLQPFIKEVKATPIGKSKIFFQFSTLLAAMPALAGWLKPSELHVSYYICSGIFAFAALIGMGSVISRLTMRDWLLSSRDSKRGFGFLRRLFDHNVDE